MSLSDPATEGVTVSVETPIPRATWRFMWQHPAHVMALGAGSGLSPVAPGTVGTLWAWFAFLLIKPSFSHGAFAVLLLASVAVGWWACTVTARHLQTADPGCIVWDEVVAFWLVLWLVTPASLWDQTVAFALFRFFDAAKPGPVAWADRVFKGDGWRGGFGILWDDMVAAACTLLVIAIGRAWL